MGYGFPRTLRDISEFKSVQLCFINTISNSASKSGCIIILFDFPYNPRIKDIRICPIKTSGRSANDVFIIIKHIHQATRIVVETKRSVINGRAAQCVLSEDIDNSSKKCHLLHCTLLLIHRKFALEVIISMQRIKAFKCLLSRFRVHQITLDLMIKQICTHVKILLS